ncbi:MAG: Fe-S cluster assembly protein SufD [marine benthic group bacterium]|nr:Fe-S cluster assembly protein SufD [Candidatus Benthicola marisminoris]
MAEGMMTSTEREAVSRESDAAIARGLASYVRGVHEPSLLAELRREGWKTYVETPMPSRKSEEWRYTDLSNLDPESFTPVSCEGDRVKSIADLPAPVRRALASDRERAGVLARHNGCVEHLHLDETLQAKGVIYAPLLDVAEDHPEILEKFLFQSGVAPMEKKLWGLHTALLSGGYVLYVPAGIQIERPIHAFRYLDEAGGVLSTHSLIIAEAGARVTCIDEYVSPDMEQESLSLNGVEIFGAEGATVSYLALQQFGRGVKHFSMQHSNTGRDSTLNGFNVTLGADLARADVTSHLEGEGARSEMLALWFGDRDQHFDHHTLQNHEAPSAHSDLLYKGALTAQSKSVFRGLIRVAEGAQLTDAYQTNRNLLLSPDASAVTLPNLEIGADDVRCSHGATVGQVDDTMLFYLMSRGLSREQSERLLVFGFFDEVLGRVPGEGVRTRIRESIEAKIQGQ